MNVTNLLRAMAEIKSRSPQTANGERARAAHSEQRRAVLKKWKLWRSRKRLALLAYLVIGLVVADSHH